MVKERLMIQNFIAIPAPLFRREAALRVGGMDERLWYTADWDLWLKLAAAGETLYDPQPRACFRIHTLSQTMRQSHDENEFRWQLQAVLQRHLSSWLSASSPRPHLSPVAEFSAEVNTALACSLHRRLPDWDTLVRHGLALGRAVGTAYSPRLAHPRTRPRPTVGVRSAVVASFVLPITRGHYPLTTTCGTENQRFYQQQRGKYASYFFVVKSCRYPFSYRHPAS